MSTALGLAMQISANTAQLAQAVQDVNAKLDSMGAAGKKAADDLGTLKNIEIAKLALGGIKAASSAFIGLSKSVLGAAESLVRFGLSVANDLDTLNDVSQRTGVGVEALQAYGGAAKLAGTDIETFAKSIQKLAVNIGNATDEESAKKFKALGISFEQLKAASPTEQFELIADALARIQDPAERAAAAVKLFGKGGIELGPLFSEGPGALAKIREEAEATGRVVSNDAVQAIGEMNDAFDEVWMTVKGLTGQIVGELAGPVAELAEDLLQVVREVGAQNIANTIASGLLDFIKMAGNAFFQLAQFIEAFVKKYSGVLGIDVSSGEDKRRASLEQERNNLQAIIDAGGESLVRRIALGVRAVQAGDKERLAAINQELAAMGPASASLIASMQQNFNAAIGDAQTSLAARTNGTAPASPNVPAPVVDTATQEQNAQQLEELRGLRRDIRSTTVEIAG